jgi:preprotein translocase subunit SecA
MVYSLLNKILGNPNEKALKKIWPLVRKINEIFDEYEKSLPPEEIPKKTEEFKERISKGESLDDLLPEAFALVKYACKVLLGKKWQVRNHEITWDMVPFDVQILGGIVLHQGKISEMKTGEGKTLVCTMPVYLNALSGKGVYVVTVNDYLAQRDAEWMGGLYNFLGLSVGIIMHGQTQEEKHEAYNSDITYGTNNEFGFDYLRDNMATDLRHLVQRELHYAIVDEVDSILIDEARTPLIISAPAEESTSKYQKYAQLVSSLKNVEDYVIDEKMKTATLTEEGIKKMEEMMGVDNIYTDAGFMEVHHIEQALKAHTVYNRDTDYVVKDEEIIIVDEFTGRLMPGRRYSDGLHQAIEAKENVEIKRESRTLATITFQNYFRLFKKLAGMTGTAMTESEEFYQIYRLETIEIPTNKQVIRVDHQDVIYKNQKGKYQAIVKKVKELNEKGAPVLIGTISIEKSEILSRLLKMEGITHSVLNAKYHEKEAEIITQAGQKGAVTIATNMAGRGTDIKLGEEIKKYGLFVLGTERHESRRIDNQLRGRSGRQGDPGESQFFLSMEDDIMRLFGGERVKKTMEMLKLPDDMPIQNKLISNSIESAQKKVEGRNFDIRKHLVSYDDVINKHREIIYARRRKVLQSDNIKNDIFLLIEKEVEKIILAHSRIKTESGRWEYKEIINDINAIHKSPVTPLNIKELEIIDNAENLIEKIKLYLFEEYEKKESLLKDPDIMRRIERSVYLGIIDTLWMEHIDNLHHLRESVALSGYGQRDPLIQYKEEAYLTFTKLLDGIQSNTVATLFRIDLEKQLPEHLLATKEPQHIITNEAQVTDILTGDRELTVSTFGRENPMRQAMNPVVVKAENTPQEAKKQVGRNDPCPCGSGKKYKKCHGR